MREMRRETEEWSKILVIYDVEVDKIRTKVVRVLESYGVRVQKSAFECHLNRKRIIVLKNQLKRIISEGDSIRIYQVKDTCFDVSEFDDIPVYFSKTVVI